MRTSQGPANPDNNRDVNMLIRHFQTSQTPASSLLQSVSRAVRMVSLIYSGLHRRYAEGLIVSSLDEWSV